MTTNALLLLPATPEGLLTSVDGTTTIPWEPDNPQGFTLHALGLRLRRKQPVVAWLRDRGLELDVENKNSLGTWFRLTSIDKKED